MLAFVTTLVKTGLAAASAAASSGASAGFVPAVLVSEGKITSPGC
jgi:hypothetical protein